MFQILHLTEMQRRLQLMLDSATPLTFVNVKVWQDLKKPLRLNKFLELLRANPSNFWVISLLQLCKKRIQVSQPTCQFMFYGSHRDGLAMLKITVNPTQLSITAAIQVELNNLQKVLDFNDKMFIR